MAHDGRSETCSYTTTVAGERWWSVKLSSVTSVGRVELTLTTPGDNVVVYIVSDQGQVPCHPLLSVSAGTSDRYPVYTDCRGARGHTVLVRDEKDTEEYFGICEVLVLRYQVRMTITRHEIDKNIIFTCFRRYWPVVSLTLPPTPVSQSPVIQHTIRVKMVTLTLDHVYLSVLNVAGMVRTCPRVYL